MHSEGAVHLGEWAYKLRGKLRNEEADKENSVSNIVIFTSGQKQSMALESEWYHTIGIDMKVVEEIVRYHLRQIAPVDL